MTKKMSTANVVTPKMLEDGLAGLEGKVDEQFAMVDERFTTLEQRLDERFEAQFVRLNLTMAQLRVDIRADLAQQRIDINTDTLNSIKSVEESYRTRTAAVDKYRDLPERVDRLEQAVGIKR